MVRSRSSARAFPSLLRCACQLPDAHDRAPPRGRVRRFGEFTFQPGARRIETRLGGRSPDLPRSATCCVCGGRDGRARPCQPWRSPAAGAATERRGSTWQVNACGARSARSGEPRCLCKPYSASAIGWWSRHDLARRRFLADAALPQAEQVSAGWDSIARWLRRVNDATWPLRSRAAHHHRPNGHSSRSSPFRFMERH